jgi:hypothetical protein
MMDREAHFPFTFIRVDKEEIRKKEKEFIQ